MNENDKTTKTPEAMASLINENRTHFEAVSKDALREFDEFSPCRECGFLGQDCWKPCGVLMKHRWKAGNPDRA